MKALFYEGGQDFVSMVQLTDDGTHQFFYSADDFISDYPGRAPVVLPNGILSGGAVSPAASGSDDVVDVAEVTCYLNGVQKTGSSKIAADTDVSITREATNGYLIASIIITSAGAIDVVEGTAHASAHSSTRGADGGPPYIAVDAIEIAQVKLTSTTSAAITEDEIFQVPGVSVEYALTPSFNVEYSNVSAGIVGKAGVSLTSASPTIHTGDTCKRVYMEYYTPIFARFTNARNFDPPRLSGSASSEATYDGAKADVSESLNAGSFEFLPDDTISHPFFNLVGKRIWLKYKPDDLQSPYQICQGQCYESGNHPAEGSVAYTYSIVAKSEFDRVIA